LWSTKIIRVLIPVGQTSEATLQLPFGFPSAALRASAQGERSGQALRAGTQEPHKGEPAYLQPGRDEEKPLCGLGVNLGASALKFRKTILAG